MKSRDNRKAMMSTITLRAKSLTLFVGIGTLLIMGMQSMQSQSEPPRLPFVHVTDEFDLNVMDILTGDVLYQAKSSEYDCPESISPDGRWLLYYTSPNLPSNRNYILIDLNTGNEIPLPHTQINFLGWQPAGFAYFHKPDNQELGTIYTYDVESAQAHPLVSDSHPVHQGMWRQLADNFAYITYNEDQITFHRWDEETTFSSLPVKQVSRFSISPDAQFVVIHGKDKLSDEYMDYILDLQTGEFDITDDFRSSWRPNSHELGYIKSDGNQVAIYDAVTEEELLIATQLGREEFLSSLQWSPEGNQFALKTGSPGGTHNSHLNLYILDVLTGESTAITSYISDYAGNMKWASATILAYTAAFADPIQTDSGRQPESADLWIYDVATEQQKQITNTPDIHEGLQCMWG